MSEKLRLMIVEDSEFFAQWLNKEISLIPNVEIVSEVQTAAQALVEILEKKPHVMILDLRLREGNGLEILKTVRSRKLELTVIVFSNYPEFRKDCLDLGADYFFDKSHDFEKVAKTIHNLC